MNNKKALDDIQCIIIGEGKSETVYFDKLGRAYKIHITTRDGHGKSLEYIKDLYFKVKDDRKKTTIVAIVIDVDEHTEKELIDFENWCRQEKIDLYLSNPCFEVWLLMHIDKVKADVVADDLNMQLSKFIRDNDLGKRYVKTQGIPVTKDNVSKAVIQSRKVLPKKELSVSDVYSRGGSTSIHLLLEKLLPNIFGRRR